MENSIDYSAYILASYAFTGLLLAGLMLLILTRYNSLRKKFHISKK